MRTSRLPLLLGLALLAAGPACKRGGGQPAAPRAEALTLAPAAEAAGRLVTSASIPDAEALFKKAGAVATKLGLPFGATELRQMLVARAGAPEAIVSRLDLGKPVGLAAIVLPASKADAPPKVSVVVAGALQDSSAAGFDAFAAALGRPLGRNKDAVQLRAADGAAGAVWLLARDGAVLACDTLEGLVAGGALALAARGQGRTAAGDDVRVSLFPEGMARAEGKELKAALAEAKRQMAEAQAQSRAIVAGMGGGDAKSQAAAGALGERMMGTLLDGLGDTTEIGIGISVDEARGITGSTAFEARPGSLFARGTPRAYAVPPALLGGGAVAGVMAMSSLLWMEEAFAALEASFSEGLLPAAERAPATAALALFRGALAGPWAATLRTEPGRGFPFSYDVVYDLKPGTDGRALLAALEATVKRPGTAALARSMMGGLFPVKLAAKRDGDALVTSLRVETKKAPEELRATFAGMPLLGGDPIESRLVVQGDKLLVAVAGEAKGRLARLRAGGEAAAGPEVAAALAETQGAHGFFLLDLGAFLRATMQMVSQNPLLAGQAGPMVTVAQMLLGQARLVTYGSMVSGDGFTVRGRIPMATLEQAAQLVRAVTGLGGARRP